MRDAPWNQTPERRERARELGKTHLVHGHSGGVGGKGQSPEYGTWKHMKARCLNPNGRDWPRYGGRGITVAPEWLHDFPAFLAHIGPRPGPEYSIDRIDNDGNYEPGNVRWATQAEQRRNATNGRGYTHHQRRAPAVHPMKDITCLRCPAEGSVRSVVSSWLCPPCKVIAGREKVARHRAKVKAAAAG